MTPTEPLRALHAKTLSLGTVWSTDAPQEVADFLTVMCGMLPSLLDEIDRLRGEGPSEGIEALVAACEREFGGPTMDEFPDDEPVAYPSSHLTFGIIRRARAAILALRSSEPTEEIRGSDSDVEKPTPGASSAMPSPYIEGYFTDRINAGDRPDLSRDHFSPNLNSSQNMKDGEAVGVEKPTPGASSAGPEGTFDASLAKITAKAVADSQQVIASEMTARYGLTAFETVADHPVDLAKLPSLIMANIEEVDGWQTSTELCTAYCHAQVLHADLPDLLAATSEPSPSPPDERSVIDQFREREKNIVARWEASEIASNKRIGELEAALKPFADAAKDFRPDDLDTMRPAVVQARHFRYALTALQGPSHD